MYENLEKFEVLLQQFSQLDLTEEERGLYNELVEFHYNYKTVTLPKAISFAKMGIMRLCESFRIVEQMTLLINSLPIQSPIRKNRPLLKPNF